MAELNPFLLAAAVPTPDARLLPLLRSNPALASQQDEHGYSLVHAAASYNHVDLLRTLVAGEEFKVDVGLKDEDGETALFVVETVEAAKCLVEELGLDAGIRNLEGLTAREKIEQEAEFPQVAEYLRLRDEGTAATATASSSSSLPPLPPNISMSVSTVDADEAVNGANSQQEPDPEFKRRIEELAARDDFQTEEGQNQLRQLITDALRGASTSNNDREVRRRVE